MGENNFRGNIYNTFFYTIIIMNFHTGAHIILFNVISNVKYRTFCKKNELRCQVVEKFHTAGCIPQVSVYFSVYYNFSLLLITDIYIIQHYQCSTYF